MRPPAFKIFLVLAFVLVFARIADCQDSTKVIAHLKPKTTDSFTKGFLSANPKPLNVAIRSAIIPGWGQITNGKSAWIKVPVLYIGLTGLVYGIVWNNNYFQQFKTAYNLRNSGKDSFANPPNSPYLYSTSDLASNIDYYRRDRDLLVIITSAVYLANIFDAYVYAHLKTFDISNDLSLRIEPINFSNIANTYYMTCSLKFNFK